MTTMQMRNVEELSKRVLMTQLSSLGVPAANDGTLSPDALAQWQQSIGMPRWYDGWMRETLRVLSTHGYLGSKAGADAETLDPQRVSSEWAALKAKSHEAPAMRAVVALLDLTLSALPDILSGRKRATEVLFASSSMDHVEGVYRNNPQADYFNGVLATGLVAYLEARLEQQPDSRLRILEIGAGTGGTSATVFERLKPYSRYIEEYCYTDISKAFLLHAQSAYKPDVPYLTSRIFNIEEPLAPQGIALGAFDVAIAANVLHATKSIRRTVRNTKATLKRNGILLLNEITGGSLFTHLTFGLLEGWWSYEDAAVRIPGTPAISPQGWRHILADEGFGSILFPAQAAHELGQQIIVAESDGRIRQPGLKARDRGGIAAVVRRVAVSDQQLATVESDSVRVAAPASTPEGRRTSGDDLRESDGRTSHLRDEIRTLLANLLRMDVGRVRDELGFADYGVDSMVAVQLVRGLNDHFSIELPMTTLFDHHTVERLARHIVNEYPTALKSATWSPSSESRAPNNVPLARDVLPRTLPVERIIATPHAQTTAAAHSIRTNVHAIVPPAPQISARPGQREPIAIIGMSARYPQADSAQELWEKLANGIDLTEEITRWSFGESAARPRGGFVRDIDLFDAMFFNISGLEATYMDPQQRLFLQEAWRALEDSGYAGEGLSDSRCGVYVGCAAGDYSALFRGAQPPQAFWGNAASIIPARIAYYLNLQGPAIAVDTACSSSLVAMHLACQGLWNGEIDVALSGGVYVQCTPGLYQIGAGMLSPHWRCYTFDERADGFVPGEGVAAVVLKRLSDALRDGDHIHGVIRGSGINQDGATNGITAPSALSQERLEREVYESFGINAEEIQMVEAHGTGTKLGDPIEWRALTNAFARDTTKRQFCAIGSIKTNVGHTTTAAGVAGVIKVLLALQNRQIPPSLNFERGNPHIDFENSPFYVNTRLRDWTVEGGKRRCAAVSSFGFSGTNAHMVIEEAPRVNRAHRARPAWLVVLSARTPEQRRELVERLLGHCEANRDIDLGNVSFTLLRGRAHLSHRLACVVSDVASLTGTLRKWLDGGVAEQVCVGTFDGVHTSAAQNQEALRRYGNDCIRALTSTDVASECLERTAAVAELFVQGCRLDYEDLFAGTDCGRVPLPTYPFSRDRYWIDSPAAALPLDPGAQMVHPLVHENSSNLRELRYSSHFSGDEFFLRDHRVQGHRVLPGVAYLEMAREALYRVLEKTQGAAGYLELRQVVWLRPLVVGKEQLAVHIGLDARENGEIAFEVYSGGNAASGAFAESEPASATVHVQGRAVWREAARADVEHWLPVQQLKDGCDRCVDIDRCYEAFAAMGIEYGPSHRGLDNVQVGGAQHGAQYVLGRVKRPECVSAAGSFQLHPSVLDCALQAGIGLSLASGEEGGSEPRAALPFALERLQILGRTPEVSLVYVRPSGSLQTGGLQKLDVEVSDEEGRVCVRLLGLSSRPQEPWQAWAEPTKASGAVEVGADGVQTSVSRDRADGQKSPVQDEVVGEGLTDESAIEGGSANVETPEQLRARAVAGLKKLVSQTLKIPVSRIQEHESLEKYGIDSILVVKLANELSKHFAALSSTVFFEHGTLGALANHLVETDELRVRNWVGFKPERMKALAPRLDVVGKRAPLARGMSVARSVLATHGRSTERTARQRVSHAHAAVEADIAIIGLAGHYPQARTLQQYWENLKSGRECVGEIPAERWSLAGFYYPEVEEALAKGGSYSKWGAFLEDFAEFDPLFFQISPLEAGGMDPQERLFLQVSWEVMEDAGYDRQSLARRHGGRVGVFAGITKTGFELHGVELTRRGEPAYLQTSFSSVVNRVSYLLDLHGPSLPIDTMCSSSLTAIHEACEHLLRGECELAIAGGVNLYLHPSNYVKLCATRMLSAQGRSCSFGEGADGFVPGEGVGAVLLKPLREAIEDEDHIYGVIRGTSINHGGHTHGYTVPNPAAQAQLIEATLRRAGVDARTVSYVEAQGTATDLGDPIEIAGLTKAFARDSREMQYCALGSVKPNIGHLESAAGIAALTKVLLQIKHGQLVPSLHSRQLNPQIDFSRTPFVVQQELTQWNRPVVRVQGQEREYPRIAGISSFGAGGANAHLIVEEYVAQPRRPRVVSEGQPALVVLSAKSAEQVQEQAQRLLAHMVEAGCGDEELADIAFTLQTGREAMEYRLGLTAGSMLELQEKLQAYVSGAGEGIAECYAAETRGNREALATLSADEDAQQLLESWLRKGKYAQVLELWVKGLTVDWTKLYEPGGPYASVRARRVSLPTYPFARQRYWVESPPGVGAEITLHPLLHENTSDLSEQRFTTLFSGEEFFCSDHLVQGRRVLPAVCYLEMARAALEHSADCEGRRVRLRDVVWAQPLEISQETAVHIGLSEQEPGKIGFEVYTVAADGEAMVHAQGRAELLGEEEASSPVLGLSGLQSQCERSLGVGECYSGFAAAGIEYGPAHQGLEQLQVGRDEQGEGFVLAQVRLPECVSETCGRYVLHPSVLDSALQATLGLSVMGRHGGAGISVTLPFALESLEILTRTPSVGWVHVRGGGSPGGAPSSEVAPVDIEVCDESGRVCVRMQGLRRRVLEGELTEGALRPASVPDGVEPQPAARSVEASQSRTVAEASPEGGLEQQGLFLQPHWEVTAPGLSESWPAASSRVLLVGGTQAERALWESQFPNHQVLPVEPPGMGAAEEPSDNTQRCESSESLVARLESCGRIEHVVWLSEEIGPRPVDDEGMIRGQERGVIGLYRLIKALLQAGYGTRELGWTVVTWQTQAVQGSEEHNPCDASVHGLVGAMAKEYAHWKVRLLDLPWTQLHPGREWQSSALRLRWDAQGEAWAYRHGEWYRQQLLGCELPQSGAVPYRRGGVYVVIGGGGGLGEVFSEHLIRTYQAQMIWLGRREVDESIRQKIARLGQLGPAPQYLQVDARDRGALERAREEIRARHGAIHAVVHAAIELLDKSLGQMEEERLRAGLAAKVDVSVRLAQVFGGAGLDFVLFFSSLQSFAKSAGQSNYAAGCTFKDAYAQALVRSGQWVVKVMNWGYWGSVGTVASQQYRVRMAQQGVGSIEAPDGMAALGRLLQAPLSQVAYLKRLRGSSEVSASSPELAWSAASSSSVAKSTPARSLEQVRLLESALPACTAYLSARSERVLQLPAQEVAQSQRLQHMQQLVEKLLLSQLLSLGLLPGSPRTQLRKLQGPRFYELWLQESVRILAEHGYVKGTLDQCEVLPGQVPDAMLDSAALWGQWQAQQQVWGQDDPAVRAQLQLLNATLQGLPAILRGERPATEVLFPNSGMELVEGVYQRNAVADHFNAVLTDALVQYLQMRQEQDARARVRILEIGAGTGGTSAGVFERLVEYAGAIQEYCYTDISQAFLTHAQRVYGPKVPYLTYRQFNVEQPPEPQGVPLGGYDVVIAANVLHATRNMRRTLRNAKALLRRNGLLLLNEITAGSLFTHLTFGLLKGWWLYEDPELRIPGTPALGANQWRRVLHQEGFHSVLFPADAARDWNQQIIVSESDGVVRQTVNAQRPFVKPTSANTQPSSDGARLRERTIAALKGVVGRALKVPSRQLIETEPLEKYGIDSLVATGITTLLQQEFPDIKSTLFFEHRTIEAVTDHLLRTYADGVREWVGLPLESLMRRESGASAKQAGDLGAPGRAPPTVRAIRPGSRRGHSRAPGRAAALSGATFDGIAVIGISGRYPQALNTHEFWENLKAGRDCVTEVPADRWDHNLYYDTNKGQPGKTACKWGGFLQDVNAFDHAFFGINLEEARQMDLQERLFLETTWHLLEDAGYTSRRIQVSSGGKIGVYVGARPSVQRGAAAGLIAGRVSKLFDLRGPSLVVDCFSASSMMAVHLACEALACGDCEVAIAGGANVLSPEMFVYADSILATQSERRGFSTGDGALFGEGVGALLLKPLRAAIRDSDRILAVIRATAVNNAGLSTERFPRDPVAAADAIRVCLRRAGIHPRTVSYAEAAAVGLPSVDFSEVLAFTKVFREHTEDKGFCALGSVKPNMGHGMAVSGLSQLTKVILQLHHGMLVPTIRTEPVNPTLALEDSPFRIQRTLQEWIPQAAGAQISPEDSRRRALVTSFGADGTDACAALEEYRPSAFVPKVVRGSEQGTLLVLSARTEEHLRSMARALKEHVATRPDVSLADLSYTLVSRREPMHHRLALIAHATDDVLRGLDDYLNRQTVAAGPVESSVPIWTSCLPPGPPPIRDLLEERQERELLDLYALEHDLVKLANFWMKGSDIQTLPIHAAGSSPVSLPPYPFTRFI